MFNSNRTAEPYYQILLNLNKKNYNFKQRKPFFFKKKTKDLINILDQNNTYSETEVKSNLPPWTKYLRKTLVFMRNNALRENFNVYFSVVFC